MMKIAMKKYDIVGLGELLVDFTYYGKSEQSNTLFEQNPGGAVPNLLSAVQSLGGKTAFIGKVGDDMHGHFLNDVLRKKGISTEGLVFDKTVFTTLAFVNLSASGERDFSFARKPGADTCLGKSEVKYELIKNAEIFHIGSLSLTNNPAREATFAALECAKENGCVISYDPNYRERLWKDKTTAIENICSVLEYIDIIKVSDDEGRLMTGKSTPEAIASVLLGRGISCVILTLGGKGAYVLTNEAVVAVNGRNAVVKDTTGAGDSFFGGFLSCMLREGKKPWELNIKEVNRYAEFANAVASIVVGRRGGILSMPCISEVEGIL